MDAALGLGHGYALHAMHPALELQAGVRRFPGLGNAACLDGHRDIAIAPEIGLLRLEHLCTPSALVGVAEIHAQQVASKECGLLATLTRLDLEDDVLAVQWIARDQKFAQALADLLPAHLESFGLLRERRIDVGKLTGSGHVITQGGPRPVRLDSGTQLSVATRQTTCLGRVGVDGRVGEALLDRGVLGGQLDAGVEHGTYLSAMSGDALRSTARHSDAAALSLPPKRFSNFATRPPESRIFWRPV